MSIGVLATEMKRIQYIKNKMGGDFVIYCIDGYKYINGPFSSTSPTQMFEKVGGVSVPIRCSMQ